MANDQLQDLKNRAEAALNDASAGDELAEWYANYLGRKGALSGAMRQLGSLSAEERPAYGKAVNELKEALSSAFEQRQATVRSGELSSRLASESVDVTLPGRPVSIGTLHPVTQLIREASEIFSHLGFQTIEGPEVEDAYYAFDSLNIPKDHPARDVWDTIFVESKSREIVLRPHTSPMQVRTMERLDPPVRVIVPGRCYRYEALDATHEWHFQQIEGLAVDEHITMTDLKGTLAEFARQLFGKERKVRFRCDFFPFVEPGVDFAIDCMVCHGDGCRVCKGTGWIEILGAGMVHPNVLAGVGYDPDRYSGFAFGCGIERLAMLKYGIQDIRAFYASDLRFLSQFNRASA
ncbi:MAG: phenylalanine--tRNA ligase subunit alpha [Nitrolancea sp.]